MAKLTLTPTQTFDAPDGRAVVVLLVEGAVDAATVVSFRETVFGYLERGARVLVLDCGGLTYINSTGMGQLVTMHDQFSERGSTLLLANVPDKVRTLFSMLGIESIYKIHADVEAALTNAGAGKQRAPAQDAQVKAEAKQPPAKAKSGTGPFPVKIGCVNCKTKLRLREEGKFRCPQCGIHYAVSDEAKVKAYNTVKPTVVELRVPAETLYCESIRSAARSVAPLAGLDEAQLDQLESAVDEAANLVISRCSKGGRVRFFHVYMVCDEKEFVCGFKASEKLFESLEDTEMDEEAKMAINMIRAGGTKLTLLPLKPQGQILKLSKANGSTAAAS